MSIDQVKWHVMDLVTQAVAGGMDINYALWLNRQVTDRLDAGESHECIFYETLRDTAKRYEESK